MPIISLIAAIDEHNGLGFQQQLLCHLPADLKHFKELTVGKTIIMGRKTFESIGRVLPNRINIIVSRKTLLIPNAKTAHSLEEALEIAQNSQEIMIIGGAELYRHALPFAQKLYLTQIHHTFKADVFFPVLNLDEWHCISKTERACDEQNLYYLTFVCYERVQCST